MTVKPSLAPHIPSFASPYAVRVMGNCDVAYGSTDGPFVVIDAYKTGDRIYVNEVTAGTIATAFHWISPTEAQELHAELEELRAEVTSLQERLAEERLNKSVPLAEVVDFFKARENRRPGADPVKVA